MSSAVLTLQAFEALPGEWMEADEGVLVDLEIPRFGHQAVVTNCLSALFGPLCRPVGQSIPGLSYLLCRDPLTIRRPDVSFLTHDRLRSAPPDECFEGSPELAVEIISPRDKAAALERKTRQYFKAGAKLVWQIYPETRTVQVHRADGSAAVLDQQGALTAPELFGDWSTPVSALFER
jgi:Uma2 family endonuclease